MEKRNTVRKLMICGMILAAALISAGLVWLLPIEDELSIRVEYSSRKYDNSFQAQLFWKTDGSYSGEESSVSKVKRNRAVLELGEEIDRVTGLRLDPTDREAGTAITSIQVRNHGIGMGLIPMREIWKRAEFYRMEQPEVKRGLLLIRPQGDDPIIVFGEDMVEEYFASCNTRLRAALSGWITAAGILAAAGVLYGKYVRAAVSYISAHYHIITRVILAAAALLAAVMAFNSFDYAHPDENMSKAAVDYYMTNWLPADIRSPEAADSFSAYGNSRLSETTFYYFLAGKAAWFAKNILGLSKYYRAFNVLLFVMMTAVYYKKGRENGFLFLMLGLTPQVWYIFSYATSDGWDYFLSFLILYQLTVKGSLFHRAMEAASFKRAAGSLVLIGALYGTLLLGKKNYYFVFAASFLLLLWRMLSAVRKKRMQIILKYAIIVAVCLSVYGGTQYMDSRIYGGNKSEIASQQREVYAEKNTEAQAKGAGLQGIWDGVGLRGQGVGLKEVVEEYGFLEHSYRSYAGNYGWMEYESPYAYYVLMGIMYVSLLAVLWRAMVAGRGAGRRTLFCLLMCLGATVPGISLWHSWTSDFQPQGRYLFAINFILAVCSCVYYRGIYDRKAMKVILCAVGCLSVYSFLFGGILCLT
ncbi:MAG: DUF2142 domain-containing protein [Lachnospiraceae bacterium]|nr:DUF2142 domain-containing protein [Lachnospiraceae bacterium]